MGVVANAARSNVTVDVPYMNFKPTIDGKISYEEWGEPTIIANKANAVERSEDGTGPDKDYPDGNLYFSHHIGTVADLAWKGWIRWDETYMYFAFEVVDTDGNSIPNPEGSNIWNGDIIQMIVDAGGPKAPDEAINNTPWTEDPKRMNMAFGLGEDGKVYTWEWDTHADVVPGAICAITYANNLRVTEVMIPHATLNGNGAAGFTYGMSILSFNCPAGEGYNGWFTWGDGIAGPHAFEDRVGSNGVKLAQVDAIIIPEEVVEVDEGPADVGTPAVTPPSGGAAQTNDAVIAVLALMLSSGAALIAKKRK